MSCMNLPRCWIRLTSIVAYDGGYAYAALKLGIYQRTMGTADGDQAALKYYIEAADKGVAPAQFLLGRWYEAGNIVTRDSSRALSYYRRALAAGEIKVGTVSCFCFCEKEKASSYRFFRQKSHYLICCFRKVES